MTITTKNKSGIKGPDIKDIGINKKRINEKFIILCWKFIVIIYGYIELILMEILKLLKTNLYINYYL